MDRKILLRPKTGGVDKQTELDKCSCIGEVVGDGIVCYVICFYLTLQRPSSGENTEEL